MLLNHKSYLLASMRKKHSQKAPVFANVTSMSVNKEVAHTSRGLVSHCTNLFSRVKCLTFQPDDLHALAKVM